MVGRSRSHSGSRIEPLWREGFENERLSRGMVNVVVEGGGGSLVALGSLVAVAALRNEWCIARGATPCQPAD